MGNSPKVSILMALYNHEKYVAQAIESVLAQTYSDWELIVWDDGSTDASLTIVEGFAATNPGKISVFRHEEDAAGSRNRGQEFTRNEALKHAKGEYLALLDSDDSYYPRKLELLTEALGRNRSAGLAYGKADLLVDATQEKQPVVTRWSPSGDVFDLLVEENFISAMATLWRKSALNGESPFATGYKTCGEYPVWLAIARAKAVEFVDETVGFWRYHSTNTGTLQAARAKAELVEVVRQAWTEETKKHAGQRVSAIRRGLARKLYDLAAEKYSTGDFTGAKAALTEAASIDVAPVEIRKKAVLLLSLLRLGKGPNRIFSKLKRKIWEFKKGTQAPRTL